MRSLVAVVLFLALLACTREQPLWLETAQQAQCSPKLLDAVSRGVDSLPKERKILVNQSLDAVASQPDTVEGFRRAVELAKHDLRTLPEEEEYFGVYSPTKDEYRNAVVLVLQARALRTGAAISTTGDVEQARALLLSCESVDFGYNPSSVGWSARIGLGPLTKPALQALHQDPRSKHAARENRQDQDASE